MKITEPQMFRVVLIVGIAMIPVILLAVAVDPVAGRDPVRDRDRGRRSATSSSAGALVEPRAAEVAPVPDDGVHRVLVVANETVGGRALLAELQSRLQGEERI